MNDYNRISADTSVIVKWFREEEGREDAILLRNYAEEGKIRLIISAITFPEVARGLKKVGWKKEDIQESLNMLDDIVKLSEIEVVDADMLVSKLAQFFVVEFNLYSADSIHLSTSILSNSGFFVSADRDHTKQNVREYSRNKGLSVLELSEIKSVLSKF